MTQEYEGTGAHCTVSALETRGLGFRVPQPDRYTLDLTDANVDLCLLPSVVG
jgi:hypothetical protein